MFYEKRGIKMAKRILSVILVLVVFFGGYAVLPKKYNPLPSEDVCAAGIAGSYRIKKYGTVYAMYTIWSDPDHFSVTKGTYTFESSTVGNIITLDDSGNIGRKKVLLINLNSAIKNGYLEKVN